MAKVEVKHKALFFLSLTLLLVGTVYSFYVGYHAQEIGRCSCTPGGTGGRTGHGHGQTGLRHQHGDIENTTRLQEVVKKEMDLLRYKDAAVILRDAQRVFDAAAAAAAAAAGGGAATAAGGEEPRASWRRYRLAVVLAHRDRLDELLLFVPHLSKFLTAQGVLHRFYVINQVDDFRFNKGSLLNIGYLESLQSCDYLAVHDIDLFPLNLAIDYSYPAEGPFHASPPELHPRYHYKAFTGGVILLTHEHFRMMNGLSNNFWGWGKEDDEFYVRIMQSGLKVGKPQNISTGYETFLHVHNRLRHSRDLDRYPDQKLFQDLNQIDLSSGVTTLQYDLISIKTMTIEGVMASIYNVKLHCDLDKTPWCLTPEDAQAHNMTSYRYMPNSAWGVGGATFWEGTQ